MSDKYADGLKVVKEMLGDQNADGMQSLLGSSKFGAQRAELALDFVFGQLWGRPGLDRRGRSLVTIGILIALGATNELKFHVLAAINNGCTVKEIEEALYHSIAYAGFPRATQATEAATEAYRAAGMID